ncbi:hypothetical protein CCR75_007929 [Bremia lactucae]|uniref:SAP domain-containing protein n=1 Tax=Bremia lactucae TaxID=4779 RepID=A0A976ID98_BRELC|nr:hypothetical protein CCR75_007929 [Bremia lactucae]
MTIAASMIPKKMKVSELRAALESRGMSSNGLKTELIQRLELALDEEEFGSEAQEMEELKMKSPKMSKKTELKRRDGLTAATALSKSPKSTKPDITSPVKSRYPSVEKISNKVEEEPVFVAAEQVSTTTEEDKASNARNIESAKIKATSIRMAEKEKRVIRAAKFGITLSLDDKKAQRAKRFQLPNAAGDEEKGKRLKRAMRFHLETNDTLAKKAELRAERFGLNGKKRNA